MLFVQGTRDRRCEVDSLRRTLLRIGAPTALQIVEGADQNFRVLKKSDRTTEEVEQQVARVVASWIAPRLDEA